MLKKLAILALMLSIVFLCYAEHRHQASGAAQSQKPADSTAPAAVQEHHGSNLQQGPPQNQATNEPKSMRIIFPPKDKYDYLTFWISVALALVGIVGIVVAVCTLNRIHRQAVEMRLQRVLMRRTLNTIRRQTDIMEKQDDTAMISAKAATISARAARKSAEAASLQIQMMKDKERARVEIDRRRGLELQQESEEFWNLKATIELRNVGTGRAYVRQGTVNLLMAKRGKERPDPDYWSPLGLVGGFVDPNGEPITESSYIFREQEFDLGALAQQIYEGTIRLYLTGFIEYDTIGTRFRRDFSYVWIGNGDPESFSGILLAEEPRNDSERVSFGFWRQDQFRPNDEYEKEPPKETAKPN